MELEIRQSSRSFVRFDVIAKEDKKASLEKGYTVMKDVEMVYITPPFTKDVIPKEIKAWKEQLEWQVNAGRISEEDRQHYLKAYDHWKKGLEAPLDGVPIKGWPVLSPAQQQTLIGLNIRTVEMLAALNDEGAKYIGMGAIEMKHKAQAWLAQAQDKGQVTIEMASLKAKNEQLEATVKQLQEQVQRLVSQPSPQIVTPDVPHETISVSDILEDDPVELYKAKFGKPPHHKMKPETILAALKE